MLLSIMKTFVLYVRLPKRYWKEIKLAEVDTDERATKFEELIVLHNENSFNQEAISS
jgi:hypothetical protein